jgi:imidazolonepropionase-like amidohydrolase
MESAMNFESAIRVLRGLGFPSRAFLSAVVLVTLGSLASQGPAFASDEILIRDVRVFDGRSANLREHLSVRIVGNRIEKISSFDAESVIPASVTVIEGRGRILMPGLIDVHTHLAINASLSLIEKDFTLDYVALRSAEVARRTLMDGFTSVRDLGGPVFGLKRAIEAGLVEGPRIFPSGAFLSQTSGHGDFRSRNDRNPTLTGLHDDNFTRMGFSIIADGRDAMLAASRQNLMQGATQIKIMAGGGGASAYDPIDTTQFTEDEMRAAVEAAADWGTYVTAHLFTSESAQRGMRAGLRCLDHAFFVDEKTIKMAARKDVFIAPQFWGLSPELFKHPDLNVQKHEAIRKLHEEAKNFVPLLKKHKVKVPFASDILGEFDAGQNSRRYELAWRAELFGSNLTVLRQATSVGGELLALSGRRNPVSGALGVIEEGAMADLLVVDGNPLEDLSVIGASSEWFSAPPPGPIDTIRLIMKDGKVFKNTL